MQQEVIERIRFKNGLNAIVHPELSGRTEGGMHYGVKTESGNCDNYLVSYSAKGR